MTAAKKVPVTVTVRDSHSGQVQEVAHACRAAGLKVDQVHAAIGTISGEAAPQDVAALERVPGVLAVETAGTYQLPPPDSELQ